MPIYGFNGENIAYGSVCHFQQHLGKLFSEKIKLDNFFQRFTKKFLIMLRIVFFTICIYILNCQMDLRNTSHG